MFHVIPGKPIYVYTSIFSPTRLNTSVIHNWQHYDEATRAWVSTAQIELPIVGGRDDGYRTYSVKNASSPGRWRVDVTSLEHKLIGRVSFTVENVDAAPKLETLTL